MGKLEGKSAIITGASRGIGKDIAIYLANEGAKVVVNYSGSKEKAEAVVEEIKARGGSAFAAQANIDQAEDVQSLVKQTLEAFGSIDILVNNAGITRDNLIMRMKEQEWDDVLNTNLKGYFSAQKLLRDK